MQPLHISKPKRYLKKFQYYFRHPYMRLLVAYGVTICNFFIYAEDPVAHSFKECTIPAIGNDYAFVATRYPPNGFSALKVFLYLFAIVLALIAGKLVIHRLLLRKCFRLSMFQNDQGSWMIMFFASIITLLIFSFIYNGFLGLDSVNGAPYKISSKMGITNHTFMKAAALGTWMGDFITAWMVTDMMLQEVAKYPDWAKPVRNWWNKGWNRVILFWAVLVILTSIVASAIIADYINWDTLNKDFVHTSELGRGFLASFILVMDFTIVMQDWDFPLFETNFDVKLPGINTAYIHFKIPDCLRKEHWMVHITGKWFNYGILLMVMLLDLNMWKNQIFYKPFDYGQYVGPNGKVYSVTDRNFLETANKSTLSYAWRWSHPSVNNSFGSRDPLVNSRYRGHSLAVTGTAFIPCLLTFVVFGSLIWLFGRTDNVDDIQAISIHHKSSLRRITSIAVKKEKDHVDGSGCMETEDGDEIIAKPAVGYGTINEEGDTDCAAKA
ncbi:transmembrane protein 117-like isoform X2 [Rhopilema esculentum]